MQFGKEQTNLSLFSDNMITWVKKSERTDKIAGN